MAKPKTKVAKAKTVAKSKTGAVATAKKKGAKGKPPADSNVLPIDIKQAEKVGPAAEIIKRHIDILRPLKRQMKSIGGKIRSANGIAKKDGLDTTALAKVIGFLERDVGDVEVELTTLVRYLVVGAPDIQLDMFEEEQAQLTRDAQIFDEGVRAGLLGKSSNETVHKASTEAGQIFLAGWHIGNGRNAGKIGKTPKKAAKTPTPAPVPEEKKPPETAKEGEPDTTEPKAASVH